MMALVPPSGRHCAGNSWLKSCFLFSFADYYDPQNEEWGAIRVFNDDRIAAGGMFPMHPHAEYEIVTLVLEGQITHEDSMGNRQTVGAGGVQAMTAGTGLTHSEANRGKTELHSYQIWIRPRKQALEPQYNQKEFEAGSWKGKLLAMASGEKGVKGAALINADATIYRCALSKGEKVEHKAKKDRKVLVYVTEGDLQVNGEPLPKESQARIGEEAKISILANKDSEFVLIDVPG